MALKFRRGTTAQKSGSLAFGEPYVNTDLGTLQIGGASGDITLGTSGTGSTGTFGAISGSGLDLTGNANIAGNVTIGGNITIGDQTTDTISFVAGINSDLIPATTTTYDLGTSGLRWNNAYLSRVEVDGVVIDSNTIQTTIGNDDLTLIANGTGRVYIPNNNVQIDQNLTVTQNFTVSTGTSYLKNTGVTGTIIQNGDFNQTGNFGRANFE